MEAINKICRSAREIKNRRGRAIICLKDVSEDEVLLFFNFPDRISSAPICVATTMFSTGHATPDSLVDVEKMYGCKDRVPGCEGCEFSHLAHEKKPWCDLANDFMERLGRFCPKDLDIEKIKESCKYYLPPEKTIGGDSVCRARLQEGDSDPCWIKTLDDLLRDPDFKIKKEA